MPHIHPTAIVHPGAELAQDVVVGPYCVIEDQVRIGAGTRIEASAQILRFTELGVNCRVHSFALVGGEPQDLKFRGEETTCSIGDNTVIREYVTVHRGTAGGGGITRVGSGCLLMAYVHVAHDCILGNRVILSNGAMLAGHVVIDDHAAVGGMSGVHQFVHIGEFAFVGAMSGIAQDIPPFLLASGSRAKLHGLNLIGLRRQEFTQEALAALRSAYKRIFRSDTPRQEALAEVETEFGHLPQIQKLLQFIRNSERGVLSASVKGENGDTDS